MNNLYSKILTPHGKRDEILRKIKTENEKGLLHILYMDYLSKLGFSSNIILPYYDEYNKNVRDLIVINNPEDAERLVLTHVKKTPYLKGLLYDSIISTTDVDEWKEQRQSYQPAFSVENELKKLIPISNERAKSCVTILHNIQKLCDDEFIDIYEFFLNEAMAQLQLAMFGFSNKYQEETNKKARAVFCEKDAPKAREFVGSLQKEIQHSIGPLSRAMKSRNNEISSNSEKFGNALIFPFAGHDTTANTLTWLIYELSKNDTVREKLHAEVDNFWNELPDKNIIEYEDLKKLKFMTRCLMETLRLWTSIPNGTFRELTKEDFITGKDGIKVKIPSGTYIQIPNWTRHRNPELWGEDVNIFNPERDFRDEEFFFDNGLASYNPSSERFSPFTYGPRDCIGKNFSQIEMRLILIHILKDFTFSLSPKQLRGYDQNNISFNSVTLAPRSIYNSTMTERNYGMYVKIIPRNIRSKL